MRTRLLSLLERHLAASILLVSLIPYGALLLYLSQGMHATETVVSHPSRWFLGSLFLVGVPLPSVGIALVLSKLVRRRKSFDLVMLLQAYFCLIVVFATGYAILQASSIEPAIRGMAVLWKDNAPASFGGHLSALHHVYIDSLYLSVITITTVGYGDMAPLSSWAKLLSATESLCGVGFMGIALGHYFSVCMHRGDGEC